MRDFNFFSEYVYVKNSSLSKKLIIPLIFVVLFSGLGYGYYYLESNVNDLESIVEANNKFIESKEYKDTIEEEKLLQGEIERLSTMQLELVVFESLLPYEYRVTEELLSDVLSAIPRNVAFDSYVISPIGITISAVSNDYSYIAEMEYNLRQLDIFESVFIRVISSSEDEGYVFHVEMMFGGEIDE